MGPVSSSVTQKASHPPLTHSGPYMDHLHAVPSCKVPVYEVFWAQVLHPTGNINHELEQRLNRQVLKEITVQVLFLETFKQACMAKLQGFLLADWAGMGQTGRGWNRGVGPQQAWNEILQHRISQLSLLLKSSQMPMPWGDQPWRDPSTFSENPYPPRRNSAVKHLQKGFPQSVTSAEKHEGLHASWRAGSPWELGDGPWDGSADWLLMRTHIAKGF